MSNLIARAEFLIQACWRRQVACPYCRSTNARILARKYALVRIRQCPNCALCFTDPIYKPLFLNSLYNAFYNAEGITTAMPDEATLAAWKASNFAATEKSSALMIRTLERISPGRDLLEIGSSWGYFLHQANRAGFSGMGVELGDERREYGVKNLGLQLFKYCGDVPRTGFDIIYSSHTLEHFTDLSTIFSDMRALLKREGVLFIAVPNFDLKNLGPRCLKAVGAVHPLGYSADFFRLNLPKIGFRDVTIYEDVESVGTRPVERSSGPFMVVVAKDIP